MRWATYSSVQCASSDRGQGPNILGFCTSDLESSRLRERISASPLVYKRFARHSRRQGQRRARQLDQPTPQLPLPPPACARLSCPAARNWCAWTWNGRPAAAFSALAYVRRVGGVALGCLVV